MKAGETVSENQYGFGGYGNDNFGYYMYQKNFRKQEEKRKIRKLGLLTGGALLLCIVLQNVIYILMEAFGIYERYLNDPILSTGLDIIFSVVEILVPFLIFGKKMQKETGTKDLVPLGRTNDRTLSLLAIPAGLGICMAANLVTSYIVIFMSAFGIELSSPEIAQPEGLSGFILSVLRVAIVAGLVEEISFRGCVMQPLRRYGDGFAIVASACAFGLMHCNLVQAQFALIVGLGLGYIGIKTGTLWSCVAIHALKNLISTCVSYLMETSVNETTLNIVYSLIVYGLIAVGGVCFAIFAKRAKFVSPAVKAPCDLSEFEKGIAYITNPTMIISIIIMLVYTAAYIKVSWL